MVNFLFLVLGLERKRRWAGILGGAETPTPVLGFPEPGLATYPLLPWGTLLPLSLQLQKLQTAEGDI